MSTELPEQSSEGHAVSAFLQTLSFTQMIDLSVGVIDGALHEPAPPSIARRDHQVHGGPWMLATFGVGDPAELTHSAGMGPASETVSSVTHVGTHIDAPFHYHPTSGGKPAKTIDECPLEWFFSDGVILDLRAKQPGEKIWARDIERALEAIDYVLKPFDIVMIMTGTDARLGSAEYLEHPGMTRESTEYILDRGIKVVGVDMYGFDLPFKDMAAEYAETGDATTIWEAHLVGVDREYCQIEKLCNLHLVPRAHGFKVAAFPIKVEHGSAGWCRPVAFA